VQNEPNSPAGLGAGPAGNIECEVSSVKSEGWAIQRAHDRNSGRRVESAGFRVNAGREGALYKGRDLGLHAAGAARSGPADSGRRGQGARWETFLRKVVRRCRSRALKVW
jgi:hypothetical protein